jgi:hypothetical protein
MQTTVIPEAINSWLSIWQPPKLADRKVSDWLTRQ